MESCRRITRCAQPGVQGPAAGRAGARDFFEAAEGEAGSARRGEAEHPGRAGRQVRAVRLRADGRWSTPGAPSCLLWFLRRQRTRCTAAWTWCAAGATGWPTPPFPLPILCPADGVEPVDSVLPDLGFVEGCCDARQSCLNLLPYVGPGWCPKVSLAAMLDLGVCRWDHIVLGISARSHVDAATVRRALERMDAAWSEGEEHMAKLSVNAMIGLWAHGGGLQRAQQQRAGRRGHGLLPGLRLRGGTPGGC